MLALLVEGAVKALCAALLNWVARRELARENAAKQGLLANVPETKKEQADYYRNNQP